MWFAFGFLCFLPALIVSLIVPNRAAQQFGNAGYGPWGSAPPPPNPDSPAAGWYADPGGSGSQRYWDGYRWTEHLH